MTAESFVKALAQADANHGLVAWQVRAAG